MTFRRWDVLSVPFPFVEGHASKRRPALVVSTDACHRAHRACFGAMITTARHMQDLRPDDIEIGDLGRAGLPRPCVICLARLATFEWGDQIRRIGALHQRERPAVELLLRRWLGG
ncbi:MAG TPA: type II toxin-antitoxin system PemK/MazF family toxin [Geminicoccaceae bacterium]|nr:type II toxin-antitoxin system PemK/MazF family toxin [Geminicoccaceae bacterium]